MGGLGGLKSGVDFAIILIGNETTKIALTAPTSSSASCAIRFICLCDMKFNEILMGGWISATEFIVCTYMKFEIERFRVNVFFSLRIFKTSKKVSISGLSFVFLLLPHHLVASSSFASNVIYMRFPYHSTTDIVSIRAIILVKSSILCRANEKCRRRPNDINQCLSE